MNTTPHFLIFLVERFFPSPLSSGQPRLRHRGERRRQMEILDSKILADLKVVWRAKNISGRLPISSVFPADLTNSAQAYFCLADLAEF
jgi:hypothetical protein